MHTGVRELEVPKYKCEASIIRGLGAKFPARSKGRAHGQEVRGTSPPEAKTLLAFGRSLKVANLNTLKKFETQKFRYNLCCLFQKNNDYRPQYVTDYCTVMKSNRLVHFG